MCFSTWTGVCCSISMGTWWVTGTFTGYGTSENGKYWLVHGIYWILLDRMMIKTFVHWNMDVFLDRVWCWVWYLHFIWYWFVNMDRHWAIYWDLLEQKRIKIAQKKNNRLNWLDANVTVSYMVRHWNILVDVVWNWFVNVHGHWFGHMDGHWMIDWNMNLWKDAALVYSLGWSGNCVELTG